MTDRECVEFLQWALPQLGLRWPGFRKVRRQVHKRMVRRLGELGLGQIADYRAYLDTHAAEWGVLDAMSRISISRFYVSVRVGHERTASGMTLEPRPSAARRKAWSRRCGLLVEGGLGPSGERRRKRQPESDATADGDETRGEAPEVRSPTLPT